ncbi:MAG: T9SS type A sorting domain-containing protein [Bacteroidota bacterium]
MLKHVLAVTALVFCLSANAQHRPARLWDATYGGSEYEGSGKMIKTLDGGFLQCGSSQSGITGDKTQDRKGNNNIFTDFWVVKTDSLGQKMWDSTYGGRYSDLVGDVIQTRDGGFLIGGHSQTDTIPFGSRSAAGKGDYDYWVIKINANGTKQWDATFGGTREDRITTVMQTADGGYLLGGYSDSRNTGDKTQDTRDTNALRTDFWVVRINSTGQKLWDRTYGSNSHDKLMDIVRSSDGGYLLIGDSYSDAGFEKSSYLRGVSDYWVVKIDSNGTKKWDRTYGGNQLEISKCIIATKDGGYLLGGASRSGISSEKTDTCRGFDDSWLVKIDSAGTVQWDATFGGDGQEYVGDMIEQPDGGYIFATNSGSNAVGEVSQPKKGNYDYWVVRMDSTGNKIWDGRYGGHGDEYLPSLVQTPDNALVLAGISSSDIGADKTQNSRGNADYWMIKLLNNDIHVSSPDDTLCIGSLASFNYDINGRFNSGNKIYVQLSDSNGNFGAFIPVDTLSLTGSGHFTGSATYIVPANMPEGSHYRLRAISTNPGDTFITDVFRIRNCCAQFATPDALNHTGELYGTSNCAGQGIFLEATRVNGATGYHWTGPDGFTSELRTPEIASITAANTGTYYVYAYNLACTSAIDSVKVTVHALPATPVAGNGGPYTVGDTIRLSCTGAALGYQWLGPQLFTSSGANPFIANAQVMHAGTYRVKVSNATCWSLYDSTVVDVRTLSALAELGDKAGVRLFPNPVQAGACLTMENIPADMQHKNIQVHIYDGLGKKVFTTEFMGETFSPLLIPELAKGNYFLHISTADKLIVNKLRVD